MQAADRDLWEDDPDPDPLLRPVWDDNLEDADPTLRPVWEDLVDETQAPAPPRRPRATAGGLLPGDAETLLAPLAAAQDALARLDARAQIAPAPVRDGLIARLALREAAGWLAAQHAWVHPTDLALRSENLAGRFDTAAQIAQPRQALPSTLATQPGSWEDPEDLAALAQAEAKVVRALALARLLTALPRKHDPFAGPEAAARLLGPLGAGDLDPSRFTAWRDALPGSARGTAKAPCPALPPLLQTANAALTWMESGTTDQPDALVALAITAVLLARSETLRLVPLPVWAGWPALGHPTEDGLPRLRAAVAQEFSSGDRAPWGVAFLGFAAEAARAGLRELDRLEDAAEAGRKLGQGLDRRSRLPAAVDLVLASPVVTPRGLGKKLGITLQAGNRILAALRKGGVVREVTGRGSFRAFGV